MNLTRGMVIGVVVAVTVMILPVYAQDALCDHDGPTARGEALGVVCHTTQDPSTMIAPAVPLIVGLGIGIIAFIVSSARRVK